MDRLEEVAKLLELEPLELFETLCKNNGIVGKRRDSLVTSYFGNKDTGCKGEQFIPPFMVISLLALIANLTKGGA